jgi:hypothetical protein
MKREASGPRAGQRWEVPLPFLRQDLLFWLYLGRMTLVSGILLAALLVWGQARPEQTFLATVMVWAVAELIAFKRTRLPVLIVD